MIIQPTMFNLDNPKRKEWRIGKKDINDSSCLDDITGALHRDNDEPAIVSAKGYKAWYQNGLRHRDNGLPAIEFEGFKCWYQNGKLHRADGPAVEFSDGSRQYWVNGVRVAPAN